MNAILPTDHAVSRNPANGVAGQRFQFQSQSEMSAALGRAADAFGVWRFTTVEERAACLVRLAGVLRKRAEVLALSITQEMGKPITQARGEIEKCAQLCEWYAQHGPAMLAPEPTQVPGQQAQIEYRPLGPVLAIMPWNFPIWQVLRGAVPIVLAGNPYILKHAPNVLGCAQLLADAFGEAEFPDGVFENINVTPELVSVAIADPRVAAVTVTGSVRAGSAIAAQAGAALKKCVLELGGSDPFIVLADADLDAAVKSAVIGRFQNSGQVCAAAKRLIIEESILPVFTEKFLAAVKALKMGNPEEDDTYIGPMARFDLRDELDRQVQRSVEEGATVLLGAKKQEGEGNFYLPTVLADVTPEMTAFRQELFGPVAVLISAEDADDAMRLANDSEFGLTGSIWTGDLELAQKMAARMETGGVFINGYSGSDARVAFGGVKKSGYGRELSHFGLREFCNVQTVWTGRL